MNPAAYDDPQVGDRIVNRTENTSVQIFAIVDYAGLKRVVGIQEDWDDPASPDAFALTLDEFREKFAEVQERGDDLQIVRRPPLTAEDHPRLLTAALQQVLVAAGVLDPATAPTGPELLMAADAYVASVAQQSRRKPKPKAKPKRKKKT